MGNFWTGRDRSKLLEHELKMFTLTGKIQAEQVVQEDVYLDDDRTGQNFIHQITIKPEKQGLPKVVLIHGYGGGGGVYFKMVEHMVNYYEVILIDLLGMGASGRPDFGLTDYDECVDYFMNSIKRWVQLSGVTRDGKFILVGHSFGGFIASQYTLRYGEDVEKLVLLSSIGVQEPPKNQQSWEQMRDSFTSPLAKYGVKWGAEMW